METFRNYFNLIKRYKAAFIMNLVGLSVALSVASLILMQIRHDLTFDSSQKDRADICLLVSEAPEIGTVGLAARPLEEAAASLPGVSAACLIDPMTTKLSVRPMKDESGNVSVKTGSRAVTESFISVFDFNFIEKIQGSPLEADGSAIIPESLAVRLFGQNKNAVGEKLESLSDGYVYTVTGVYADFPSNSSLGNELYYLLSPKKDIGQWTNFNYNLFARFQPGAFSEDSPAAGLLWETASKTSVAEIVSSMYFVPLDRLHFTKGILFETFPKADPARLLVFLAIAVAVLVIACINMMNYNTALAPVRAKGINTMKVLGSPKSRLCISIIAESVITGIAAWILSVATVLALKGSAVASLIDPEITFAGQIPVFAVTLAAVAIFSALAGVYPGMYITSFPPALALKGNIALSPKGKKLRMVLVGFQFAVSFFLIVCISVVLIQNSYMKNKDTGYDKDSLITIPLDGQLDRSDMDIFRNEAADIPGIESVAFADILASSEDNIKTWGREMNGENRQFNVIAVSGDFFNTIGARITEGRNFRENGDEASWIFNETARKAFGLTSDNDVNGDGIIGFVNDIQLSSFRKSISPTGFIYDPDCYWHGDNDDIAYIRISSGADPQTVRKSLLEVLAGLAGDYQFDTFTSDDLFRRTYGKEREFALLISLFGAIAVVISLVGVSGLVMFDSESRRKEIAVRKVMGATSADVLNIFNRTYMMLLMVCILISAPLSAIFTMKWMDQFSTKAEYPWWVLLPAALLLAAVTAATVSLQCLRTARRNPVENLKNE